MLVSSGETGVGNLLEGYDDEARNELAGIVGLESEPLLEARQTAWARRPGVPAPDPDPIEPYSHEHAGETHPAVAWSDKRGLHYNAALAMLWSDDPADVREAHDRLEQLGLPAVADKARRRLKALGADSVPTGPRVTTRDNPLGLIAAELVLSERTVDHHVSAILRKLGVSSRQDAALWLAAA